MVPSAAPSRVGSVSLPMSRPVVQSLTWKARASAFPRGYPYDFIEYANSSH